jgi:diaminohydroxyphosphoribosylaminopyrimidine deaminase/5-amino-6-(5-phosphoribosylamino)uracil reductase
VAILIDESIAMKRALQLSELGLGLTSPNPIVGAVIIDAAGKKVGEGFHQRVNDLRHAEVVALDDAGAKAKGATLVLTLEPCSHEGKTPPCTEAIIAAGIKRVVFAVSDPNPIAKGGAEKLRAAGIEVINGLLEKEVRFSNRAWLKKISKNRPYITLKLATSLDGKIAAANGSSKWITNEISRGDVARLRSECDAIVTGIGTVIADDPALTVRGVERAGAKFAPTRIIMGKRPVPSGAKILDESAPTIHLETNELSDLMELARAQGWNRILIEAGPKLVGAFLNARLFDELFLYQAPTLLGGGNDFTGELEIRDIAERIDLELRDFLALGDEKRDMRLHLLAVRD